MNLLIWLTVFCSIAAAATLAALYTDLRHKKSHRSSIDNEAEKLAALIGSAASNRASDDLGDALNHLNHVVEAVARRYVSDQTKATKFEQALDAIPLGVVIVDETGEVLYQNRFAAAYESARHSEALVRAAIDEVLEDALEGTHVNRTLDLFGPPRRTIVVTAAPLYDGAGLMGVATTIEDITERVRLDAIRRDFVANISHELKTPIGALSLLAETVLIEDDPKVRQRLSERMFKEAIRISRTIEDLLELSRIETEQMPTRDFVPVDMIVGEATDRIRPAAEQCGVSVEIQEHDHNLAVLGDRRQLVSALSNLLDNAVKYSEPSSRVVVAVNGDGKFVDLEVIDSGIGISSRDVERVFERFYRVDHARSRQTGGTGLGLAIVRHVVNNHNGEIRVDSHVGEGSTFALRLPLASSPPSPSARNQSSSLDRPSESDQSSSGDNTADAVYLETPSVVVPAESRSA